MSSHNSGPCTKPPRIDRINITHLIIANYILEKNSSIRPSCEPLVTVRFPCLPRSTSQSFPMSTSCLPLQPTTTTPFAAMLFLQNSVKIIIQCFSWNTYHCESPSTEQSPAPPRDTAPSSHRTPRQQPCPRPAAASTQPQPESPRSTGEPWR